MDPSVLVGYEVSVDAGHRPEVLPLLLALVAAVGLAIALLGDQAEPAAAQISIGSIIGSGLRSFGTVFGGLFAGVLNPLLAALGRA